MHRVFYEPSLNFIVSMVDGAGEVTAHRLSDNAYRVKRVVGVGVDTGFNPPSPIFRWRRDHCGEWEKG